MKKVADYVEHYYGELGYNCAETVFLSANDAWGLGIAPETARVMGGFGGGMGTRNVCGAVSGGIAALSYRYVQVSGHQSPLLMAKVRLFINTVKERLGGETCAFLNPKYRSEIEGCLGTVRRVAEILDEIDQVELSEPVHRPRAVKPYKLAAVLNDADWIVVDARSNSLFTGVEHDGAARAGHIKGAVNFPAEWLIKDDAELKSKLQCMGITPDKHVVLCDVILKDAVALSNYLLSKDYKHIWYFNLNRWEGEMEC